MGQEAGRAGRRARPPAGGASAAAELQQGAAAMPVPQALAGWPPSPHTATAATHLGEEPGVVDPDAVHALGEGVEEAHGLAVHLHRHARVPGVPVLVVPRRDAHHAVAALAAAGAGGGEGAAGVRRGRPCGWEVVASPCTREGLQSRARKGGRAGNCTAGAAAAGGAGLGRPLTQARRAGSRQRRPGHRSWTCTRGRGAWITRIRGVPDCRGGGWALPWPGLPTPPVRRLTRGRPLR